MNESWKKRTKLVHGGIRRSQYKEVSEAIFLTQGFVYDSAEQAEARFQKAGEDEFIYARYGNPTMAMFEDRIAGYLGYEDAFACASGMAAVNAALTALLKAGDHVVASRALFGSCLYVLQDILGRFGVDITLVDGTDNAAWAAAIGPDTTLVFLESISNPTLEVIDLKHVCDLAHANDALVLVDDAMATPVFSYAKACGADISIISTTKHVDGQGRMLGGVICGPKDLIRGPIETYAKHTGGAMNPFTAWTHLKALETMELRVRAQAAAAQQIAEDLSGHTKLTAVRYPTHEDHPQHALARRQAPAGGTVLTFEVKGGKDACFRVLNALEVVTISNNFADAKSIATHPATTTHQRLPQDQKDILGISDGLVRFSVGLEDPDDLIADLKQALERA
ncbi:O-succinylhomoserine sulfhydrylase [Thalassovita gelatinovora]|uniref:O-succinylhomoserine sulfhydrylase n=1 Tax=Thalassovita gelatinovora TaxID=53501 RepID=A0A0P1FBY4_THAGE|nr:aminotransferase class I/II-fold pyridoxal phosphate-dependent enzyme [Thalassovita gelatinovora]QIZ79980.1 aminotransferase class I/II-fold pyridoxal phosphate-dependent enzyme [Thalassovita gelatinovora]CUH65633.1 O-succinylhomoserine sulfhydrylase [Thalassovita gelatinovora]SER05893.1 O-succinylhomoserine sulfhydrylase [Thalassovita gelatinovora]